MARVSSEQGIEKTKEELQIELNQIFRDINSLLSGGDLLQALFRIGGSLSSSPSSVDDYF